MDDTYGYYLGGFIIVLLIFIILMTYKVDLTGLWTADSEFLKRSGLSSFSIYIGEPLSGVFRKHHGGYIYAMSESGVTLEDNRVDMWIRKCIIPHRFNVKFEGLTMFPKDVKFRFDSRRNHITIYSGTTVYAELYRDNILSDHARAMPLNQSGDNTPPNKQSGPPKNNPGQSSQKFEYIDPGANRWSTLYGQKQPSGFQDQQPPVVPEVKKEPESDAESLDFDGDWLSQMAVGEISGTKHRGM
jgi:hypothetical protein